MPIGAEEEEKEEEVEGMADCCASMSVCMMEMIFWWVWRTSVSYSTAPKTIADENILIKSLVFLVSLEPSSRISL
jgi:hypothetical protein